MYSKGRGYKEDKYGFILINTKHKLMTNEPYVLASQAEQVYYVKDTKDPNWLLVVKTKPRDWYDMPDEVCQENEDVGSVSFTSNTSDNEHAFSLNRNDLGQSITTGNPMMPMEVIDDEDEESDDASIDVTDDEENNVIDEDDSDDN